MDIRIEKHKIEGRIAIWEFDSKNYPHFNLSLEKDAKYSILSLINKMIISEWPSTKTIVLSDPKDLNQDWISNIRMKKAYQTLEFRRNKKLQNSLTSEGHKLKISLTDDKLLIIKAKIEQNAFDEAIEIDNNQYLQFW